MEFKPRLTAPTKDNKYYYKDNIFYKCGYAILDNNIQDIIDEKKQLKKMENKLINNENNKNIKSKKRKNIIINYLGKFNKTRKRGCEYIWNKSKIIT